MPTREVNYDGLVGPTHHYGGLALGNLASQQHARQTANPRAAALQGLAKMKRIHDLGIPQAVLPPHHRPDIHTLRTLGFTGDDATILANAQRDDPTLLAACASASAMWAANAATVSPSPDTTDGRIHLTPANLLHAFHRSLETPTTAAILQAILPDEAHFAHHAPLPAHARYADEGAANHMRLAPTPDTPGLEIFVFGRACDDPAERLPHRYPARQAREASHAIARRHTLAPDRTLLLRQNPDAIDAGAFHNDVVAVSHENVLLHHELAFAEGHVATNRIRDACRQLIGDEPVIIEIAQRDLPLHTAVSSYLFNSQLLSSPQGDMLLLAPLECREDERVRTCIERIIADATNPLSAVHYVDVRQSMHNGGGPACLRLRVLMNDAQYAAAHPHVMFSDALYHQLTAWVERHYRETLTPADLADPALLHESRTALDELTTLLHLPPIYPFQR